MIKDSFYIGAYWEARKESLEASTNRTLSYFQRIISLHPIFNTLYEPGWSKKKALEKPIEFNITYFQKKLVKGLKKGEIDADGFCILGFNFSCWSEKSDGVSWFMHVSTGSYSPYLTNSNVISFSSLKEDDKVLTLNLFIKIMEVMINSWEPEYCILGSSNLRDFLDVGNQVGWATYNKNIKNVEDLPHGFTYSTFSGDKIIITLDIQEFDIENIDSKNQMQELKKWLFEKS